MIQRSMKKLLNVVLLSVCATSAMAQSAPPPTMMTIVVDEAGPAWKRGRPLEEQNMGPHLGYVAELFKAGKVVAYGTQGETNEVRGFYVLAGSEPGVAQSFIGNDPGVRDGVLKNASRIGWAVAVDAFVPAAAGEKYSILRYRAGPKWAKGKSVSEQDISAHFGYMIEQSKRGVVVAAGPSLAGDDGLYVVRGEKAAVSALIASDPGVVNGIFKPEIIAWNVLAMQASRR